MAVFEVPVHSLLAVITLLGVAYLIRVRLLRYERARKIEADFGYPARPLSTMTVKEARQIVSMLQQLEFPAAMEKARSVALVKTGSFPSMTKLVMATGQSAPRTALKRAIDTKILISEVQMQDPESTRYLQSVARMNYLHDRYRKAGKIVDEDMLHTLGDNIVEIYRCVDAWEWRRLTEVERCALGVLFKLLGDGAHFAEELSEWCLKHEQETAGPALTNFEFFNNYFNAKVALLPNFMKSFVRRFLAAELNTRMQEALGLTQPESWVIILSHSFQIARKWFIRYLCFPRSDNRAESSIPLEANPLTGFYNMSHTEYEPWYSSPSKQSTLISWFRKLVSAPEPGKDFHGGGYDLMSIGPRHQEGKGKEEMGQVIETLRERDRGACPYSRVGEKEPLHRLAHSEE